MKKALVLLFSLFAVVFAKDKYPGNIDVKVCSAYVAANATAYTNAVTFAGGAYKVGVVVVEDTSLASQCSLDIGDGAKIYQQVGIITGNYFGTAKSDTLWHTVGDTARVAFLNAEGLSKDSLICSTLDTNKMTRTLLGAESLWVSKGYFSLIPDPSPLTRFKLVGSATLGAAAKKFLVIVDQFVGVPTWER